MKHCIFLYFIIVSSIIIFGCSAKKKLPENIQTLTSFELTKLDSLISHSSKKTVVFIHTDWCTYCKNMEVTSFRNDQVIEALNTQFNFVSFDAESTKDIVYKNKVFKYKPSGRHTGTHELAEMIGMNNDQLNYPTLVIIDQNYEILFRHSAFMSGKELKIVLQNNI